LIIFWRAVGADRQKPPGPRLPEVCRGPLFFTQTLPLPQKLFFGVSNHNSGGLFFTLENSLFLLDLFGVACPGFYHSLRPPKNVPLGFYPPSFPLFRWGKKKPIWFGTGSQGMGPFTTSRHPPPPPRFFFPPPQVATKPGVTRPPFLFFFSIFPEFTVVQPPPFFFGKKVSFFFCSFFFFDGTAPPLDLVNSH